QSKAGKADDPVAKQAFSATRPRTIDPTSTEEKSRNPDRLRRVRLTPVEGRGATGRRAGALGGAGRGLRAGADAGTLAGIERAGRARAGWLTRQLRAARGRTPFPQLAVGRRPPARPPGAWRSWHGDFGPPPPVTADGASW